MSDNKSVDHVKEGDVVERTSKKAKLDNATHQTIPKINIDLERIGIETSMFYSNLLRNSKQQAIQFHQDRKLNKESNNTEFTTPPVVQLDTSILNSQSLHLPRLLLKPSKEIII